MVNPVPSPILFSMKLKVSVLTAVISIGIDHSTINT
uniref:Uncharacterized protein n=1 Tax=Salmonella phage PMBT22 TaxID=3153513 RepID=A0AAU8GMX5_9CAUD